MTLKKYIELWIYRHSARRRRRDTKRDRLMSLLQMFTKTEQYQSLNTGEEVTMFLWWSFTSEDQPLVKQLISGYRSYCRDHRTKPETITLI